MFLILRTCTAQLSSQNYTPHSSKCRLHAYASERSTFSFDSGDWFWTSISDVWDSCFAAACRTRFWTSEDEGDVGKPMRLFSSFPAAHENAWTPSLTGERKRLQRSIWNPSQSRSQQSKNLVKHDPVRIYENMPLKITVRLSLWSIVS